MSNDTLNQCLFCKASPISDPQSVGYGKASMWAMWCQNCGAQGPECNTPQEAIERWNNAQAQEFKRCEITYNEQLVDDIEEYLHWRKVNPQIKGGENYLKRFRESLTATKREIVLDKRIGIGGNHLASALSTAGIDVVKERTNFDYWKFLEMHGQPWADIFVAWKAIMDTRDNVIEDGAGNG